MAELDLLQEHPEAAVPEDLQPEELQHFVRLAFSKCLTCMLDKSVDVETTIVSRMCEIYDCMEASWMLKT